MYANLDSSDNVIGVLRAQVTGKEPSLDEASYKHLMGGGRVVWTGSTYKHLPPLTPTPPTATQHQAEFQTLAQMAFEQWTGPSGPVMQMVATGASLPASYVTYAKSLLDIIKGTDTTSTVLPIPPVGV